MMQKTKVIFTCSRNWHKKWNFRDELHPLLKNSTITDEELLGCVMFAGSNESEWSEKFSNKKKIGASIFSID